MCLVSLAFQVNHSPSYHTDQEMDRDIKEGLLSDALKMLRLESLDRDQYLRDERQRVQDRLTKQLRDRSRSKIPDGGDGAKQAATEKTAATVEKDSEAR